jgi:hypothetical protein
MTIRSRCRAVRGIQIKDDGEMCNMVSVFVDSHRTTNKK